LTIERNITNALVAGLARSRRIAATLGLGLSMHEKQFSIRSLFWLTTVAAILLWLVRVQPLPGLLVIAGVVLIVASGLIGFLLGNTVRP
jgi:hypothetical protein